jgi:proprotein convertase subtilisin/kexin type 5
MILYLNQVVYLVFLISSSLIGLTRQEEEEEEDVFHNQFAVHVPGGPKLAARIAGELGFDNLGQIGALEHHYLFEHPHVEKRSIDLHADLHVSLVKDPDVVWFEQQKELKRVKRQAAALDIVIPDPLYRNQWFLNHGAVDGSDMNVLPAWEKGYTGKGVVVTILDDGIQANHPDLAQNYDPQASTDINGGDNDPTPRDNGDNKHGTRCAGEVAAVAFNEYCGVGIAYNASIGGKTILLYLPIYYIIYICSHLFSRNLIGKLLFGERSVA